MNEFSENFYADHEDHQMINEWADLNIPLFY